MAFSPSYERRVQLGREATPGVVVPADRHLQAFGLDADPQMAVTNIDPVGTRYGVGVNVMKEHTKLTVQNGNAAYNDLCYWLDGLLYHTTPAGGVYEWLAGSLASTVASTYTVELGDNVNNQVIPFVHPNSLTLTFPPNGNITMAGDANGRQILDVDGTATPLTTATTVPLRTLEPRGTGVYIGTSLASLDSATLLGDLTTTFQAQNFWGMVFENDPAQTSFSDLVPLKPAVSGSFIIPAGSVARAAFTSARNGDGFFIRVVNSRTIGGVPYSLSLDVGASYNANPAARGDNQGVYSYTFPWLVKETDDLGGAFRFRITTDWPSL